MVIQLPESTVDDSPDTPPDGTLRDATSPRAAIVGIRYLPGVELPPYTYVPGSGAFHPLRDPRGHSYGRESPPAEALTGNDWTRNFHYLRALDDFNHGFYWEAHEEWECLWHLVDRQSPLGKFLKGLIKLAAAGVKVRERSAHGLNRHATSAKQLFVEVAGELQTDRVCGLNLSFLQEAAQQAARQAFDHASSAEQPTRLFPFVLTTDPLPPTAQFGGSH